MSGRGRGKPQESFTDADGQWHRVEGTTVDGKPLWQAPEGHMDLAGPPKWVGERLRRRHLIVVTTKVFEGYAFLTDEEAERLQAKLDKRYGRPAHIGSMTESGIAANIYLRGGPQDESDHTTMEAALAAIQAAVPHDKDK